MSKENKSSETAQQSGPSQVTASEEMVTTIPHCIGLADLATSINLIGSEAASVTNLQAPLSSHISRIPGSPERSDDKKSPVKTSPILGRPKRYLREWAGYPARWKSKVISLLEANMTLAGCAGQAMLELREWKYYGSKPFVPEPSPEAASFLPSYGAETKFTLENREGPSSCHQSAKALPSARHPGLPMAPTAYRHLQTADTGETSTDEAHQLHERLSQRTKRRRSQGSRSS